MNDVKTYIDSGILEMYLLGVASENENKAVAVMAVFNSAVQNEINKIGVALYDYLH